MTNVYLTNAGRDNIHEISVMHGFHNERKSQKHFLTLIVSELGEVIQADRSDKHADVEAYLRSKENPIIHDTLAFEGSIKDSVEDELADVILRMLDFAGEFHINIDVDLDKLHYQMSCMMNLPFTEQIYLIMYYVIGTAMDIVYYKKALNYTLALCLLLKMDILFFLDEKTHYNLSRDYLHGKKY